MGELEQFDKKDNKTFRPSIIIPAPEGMMKDVDDTPKKKPRKKLKKLDYRETIDDLFYSLNDFWKPALGVMELDLMASTDRGDGKTNSKCNEWIDEKKDMFESEWLLQDGSEPQCMFINQPQSINSLVIPEVEKRWNKKQFNLLMLADSRVLKTKYSVETLQKNWIPINDNGHIFYYPIPHNMYFNNMEVREKEHGGATWLVIIWVKDIDRKNLILQTKKLYQHLVNLS